MLFGPLCRQISCLNPDASQRACNSMPKGRLEGGGVAAVLPGDSFTSEVVVGGLLNFLSIYNILITGRVLLSWVPQVQQ